MYVSNRPYHLVFFSLQILMNNSILYVLDAAISNVPMVADSIQEKHTETLALCTMYKD